MGLKLLERHGQYNVDRETVSAATGHPWILGPSLRGRSLAWVQRFSTSVSCETCQIVVQLALREVRSMARFTANVSFKASATVLMHHL